MTRIAKNSTRVRTVAQVGTLQAKVMLTTERVGTTREDPEMALLRPVLSRMNAHGLVTVDSQMGHKLPGTWQRAYVSGFVAKENVRALVAELQKEDGLLVLQFPHGESMPPEIVEFGLRHMPRMPVTLYGSDLKPVTRMPLGAAQSWSEMWSNLLPESGLRADHVSRDAVMKDAVQLYIVDLTWGRRTWLFGRVLRWLRALSPELTHFPNT